MKFRSTEDRIKVSRFWFDRIRESYSNSNETVEYYTEAFLISSRSVIDYVVRDYLDSIKPAFGTNDKLTINWRKKKIAEGDSQLPAHAKKEEILQFLKIHNEAFKSLMENIIIKYFFTKRNVIVHHTFSGMYDKTYEGEGKNERITSRRFETQSVGFLMLSSGGYLRKQDGGRIKLSSSVPIDDFELINNLTETQEKKLVKLVTNTEALDLLQQYWKLITSFVEEIKSKSDVM